MQQVGWEYEKVEDSHHHEEHLAGGDAVSFLFGAEEHEDGDYSFAERGVDDDDRVVQAAGERVVYEHGEGEEGDGE